MRSPKKRSLLGVNEHFEGEHNAEIHFLFSLLFFMPRHKLAYRRRHGKQKWLIYQLLAQCSLQGPRGKRRGKALSGADPWDA